MLAKLMGIGDVVAALTTIVVALFPSFLPRTIVFYAAGYLIFKGGMFALGGNIISYIDVFCGIYLILLTYGVSVTLITIFVVFFLIQKNILSLIQ